MAAFGDRILRCTDGHLFVSGEASRLFGSVHLGPVRRMQCLVDGKIVNVANVQPEKWSDGRVEPQVLLEPEVRGKRRRSRRGKQA